MVQLRKAEKKQAKLRIGLAGTSGSGKTYSALLMAYGMTGDWNKICIIDTENGSADLYAHLGGYNVLTLTAPFTPERYIEYIKSAEVAGMEVIIIDSITHEWNGSGGCLEIAEQVTQGSYSKNSYVAWAKVTPRHKAFIDSILQSPAHIITTVRRKQDYDMGKDANGKLLISKVGLKEETREGFEYELTLSFNLTQNHLAETSKDRTSLFMVNEKPVPEFVISKETGEKLKAWANSGVAVDAPKSNSITSQPVIVQTTISDNGVKRITDFQRRKLFSLGKDLGKNSDETKDSIKKYFKVEHFNDLTENQAASMIQAMMNKKKANESMNENVNPDDIPL